MDLKERAAKLKDEYKGVSKIALAYSGGLDSVVLASLLSGAGFSVFPIVVNLGQKSDFARISANAKKMFGSCRIVDCQSKMAESIQRAVKSNFGSDGRMGPGGLSRPVLAQALAEQARLIGCDAIAHGSSGTGNDHIIMENSLRTIAPEMRIIAPVRDLDMRRDEALSYARENRLITNLPRAIQFSSDENLWCRTVRQGSVANDPASLPDKAYKWAVSPQKAPGKPSRVSIKFDNGMLVFARVNGKPISNAAKAISALNEIGGKNGVGRLDVLDDKLVGLKVREVYECPAAQILLAAHRALESLVLTSRELDAKRQVDSLWAKRVHEGYWHTRLRHSLDAFTDEISRTADGEVEIELYKGGIRILSCQSPHALYDARLSSRDSKAVFSQKEARHFAKLYGLQEVIAHMVGRD